jgi:hypothetical protein
MSASKNRSGRTVRITVKLRPDEYDAFCCHVRHIGSNMSAFFRESAEKAMQEQDWASIAVGPSIQHDRGAHVDAVNSATLAPEPAERITHPWRRNTHKPDL